MFDGVGRRSDQKTGHFLNIGQHSLNGFERNCLFRNDGDGTFTEVAWVNDADRLEDGRGLSTFDYDHDGRVDLLLRNYRQPAVLLRNRGTRDHHWVSLQLVGTRSNRDAIGARLRVRTGAHWQTRVVEAGTGYLSSHSIVQHLGVGRATTIDAVEITWPSGARSTSGPLPVDQHHRIVEPAS